MLGQELTLLGEKGSIYVFGGSKGSAEKIYYFERERFCLAQNSLFNFS